MPFMPALYAHIMLREKIGHLLSDSTLGRGSGIYCFVEAWEMKNFHGAESNSAIRRSGAFCRQPSGIS